MINKELTDLELEKVLEQEIKYRTSKWVFNEDKPFSLNSFQKLEYLKKPLCSYSESQDINNFNLKLAKDLDLALKMSKMFYCPDKDISRVSFGVGIDILSINYKGAYDQYKPLLITKNVTKPQLYATSVLPQTYVECYYDDEKVFSHTSYNNSIEHDGKCEVTYLVVNEWINVFRQLFIETVLENIKKDTIDWYKNNFKSLDDYETKLCYLKDDLKNGICRKDIK